MKKLITILFVGLLTVSLSAQDEGTFAIILDPGIGFASTTITDMEGIGGQIRTRGLTVPLLVA